MYRILAWLACTRFPVSFDLLPAPLFSSSPPLLQIPIQFCPSNSSLPPSTFNPLSSSPRMHPSNRPTLPLLHLPCLGGAAMVLCHTTQPALNPLPLTLSAPRLVILVHKTVRVKVPLCAMRQRPGHKSALAARELHRVPFI